MREFAICIGLISIGAVVGWGTSISTICEVLLFIKAVGGDVLLAVIVSVWSGIVFIRYAEVRSELAILRKLSGDANPQRVVVDVGEDGDPNNSQNQKQLANHLNKLAFEFKRDGLKGLEGQTIEVRDKLYEIQPSLSMYVNSDGWLKVDEDIANIRLTLSDIVWIALLIPTFSSTKK